MAEHPLDTTGLICPLPVLRARKAMQQLPPGDVLVMTASDPAALRDVPAFCKAAGHDLLETVEAGAVFTFRIRRSR